MKHLEGSLEVNVFFSNSVQPVFERGGKGIFGREMEREGNAFMDASLCRFSLPPENCKNPDWSDWSIAALIP